MPIPWRIEARATPFSKPQVVARCYTLDQAIKVADTLKARRHYYVVKVRAF